MAYYEENATKARRNSNALPIIAALIFGVLAGAYATSGNINLPALQSDEVIIPGQDWHGNVRRSDR